ASLRAAARAGAATAAGGARSAAAGTVGAGPRTARPLQVMRWPDHLREGHGHARLSNHLLWHLRALLSAQERSSVRAVRTQARLRSGLVNPLFPIN
ncbi:hypothetical protein PMAYCL1PPCAC_09676, partial [Pristionchus mayeri]